MVNKRNYGWRPQGRGEVCGKTLHTWACTVQFAYLSDQCVLTKWMPLKCITNWILTYLYEVCKILYWNEIEQTLEREIGTVLRAVFLKLPRLAAPGLIWSNVFGRGNHRENVGKCAHAEPVLYKSLPWATSDHEKEEKMWCKRWNGFWLIDERSQKKSWFMVNNPIHQNTFPAPASRANNTSMGIQQKGQRLIRVKLRTKAEIFLLASVALMSWNGAPFHVEYVKPGDHRGDPRFISSPITAGDPYSGRWFSSLLIKPKKACLDPHNLT